MEHKIEMDFTNESLRTPFINTTVEETRKCHKERVKVLRKKLPHVVEWRFSVDKKYTLGFTVNLNIKIDSVRPFTSIIIESQTQRNKQQEIYLLQ
mmetsp:Transcript_10375/g.18701  ORF Transcript_10375/g.18701 Transcript_10375/m.18701 type:complete len:95 (-) Transcript_10375:17-301(-)